MSAHLSVFSKKFSKKLVISVSVESGWTEILQVWLRASKSCIARACQLQVSIRAEHAEQVNNVFNMY